MGENHGAAYQPPDEHIVTPECAQLRRGKAIARHQSPLCTPEAAGSNNSSVSLVDRHTRVSIYAKIHCDSSTHPYQRKNSWAMARTLFSFLVDEALLSWKKDSELEVAHCFLINFYVCEIHSYIFLYFIS